MQKAPNPTSLAIREIQIKMPARSRSTPMKMSKIKMVTLSRAGRGIEKPDHQSVASDNVQWYKALESCWAVSCRTEHIVII